MLYIMRHGRTDWNERNKLQGRTDIPLNEAGRKMAEEAAAVYKNVPLDVCYCVRTVGDDEAIVFFIIFMDSMHHHFPVFWLHVRAVQI